MRQVIPSGPASTLTFDFRCFSFFARKTTKLLRLGNALPGYLRAEQRPLPESVASSTLTGLSLKQTVRSIGVVVPGSTSMRSHLSVLPGS